MENTLPSHPSGNDSLEYYKNLALEYKGKLDETQQELEEFQVSSRELEAELESQLEQLESKNRDLKLTNSHLQMECEKLQGKLDSSQMETYQVISNLQDELTKTKLLKDDLQKYVRILEQKNDDLERAMRASLTSLEDFEGRLNQAIERNVFLESELDEKENMTVLIQRLKDEARDLKQELLVKKSPNNETCKPPGRFKESVVDSNKLVPSEGSTPVSSPKRSYTHPSSISSAMKPDSALNIVGDLLKKVGVLESKLQSCRNCIKENPVQLETKNSSTVLTSPSKVRLLNGPSVRKDRVNPKDRIPFSA